MNVLVFSLIVSLIVLVSYMFSYKSLETFVEPALISLRESSGVEKQERVVKNHPELQFNKAFNLKANSFLFEKPVDFNKDVKFEGNNKIVFNKNVVMNSEQSLFFEDGDTNNKLSRGDLLNIKKNKSKIEYMKSELENTLLMKEGEVQFKYPWKTTGDKDCTSKLWDIAIGKEVSKEDLCVACCRNVNNDANFKALITFKNGSSSRNEYIALDITNDKTHYLMELNTNPSVSYQITLTLFKNNKSFVSHLYFILVNNETKNRLRSLNKASEMLEMLPSSSITKHVTDTTPEKDYGNATEVVEWGAMDNGIYIPTSSHLSSVRANFVLMNIVTKPSV